MSSSKLKWHSLRALLLGAITSVVMVGCGQAPPPPPMPVADPGGMGMTPQERLEALKSNTSIPDRVKERKIKILEDEINNTHTAGPGGK